METHLQTREVVKFSRSSLLWASRVYSMCFYVLVIALPLYYLRGCGVSLIYGGIFKMLVLAARGRQISLFSSPDNIVQRLARILVTSNGSTLCLTTCSLLLTSCSLPTWNQSLILIFLLWSWACLSASQSTFCSLTPSVDQRWFLELRGLSKLISSPPSCSRLRFFLLLLLCAPSTVLSYTFTVSTLCQSDS